MSIKSYDREHTKKLYKTVNNDWVREKYSDELNRGFIYRKENFDGFEIYNGEVHISDWLPALHGGPHWICGTKKKGFLKEAFHKGNRRKTHYLIHTEQWDLIPNHNTPVYEDDIWNWS